MRIGEWHSPAVDMELCRPLLRKLFEIDVLRLMALMLLMFAALRTSDAFLRCRDEMQASCDSDKWTTGLLSLTWVYARDLQRRLRHCRRSTRATFDYGAMCWPCARMRSSGIRRNIICLQMVCSE